jgi:hypothetical protein
MNQYGDFGTLKTWKPKGLSAYEIAKETPSNATVSNSKSSQPTGGFLLTYKRTNGLMATRISSLGMMSAISWR